jgi:diguanylate cyclase (GGDEF)-like protein
MPPGRFKPADADTVYALGPSRNLWLHLRVLRPSEQKQGWRIAFPQPVLDSVTVFQQDDRGNWVAQSAGDTIANRLWPEVGRYPIFRVEAPPGQVRDIYVCVHHVTPIVMPVRLASDRAHDARNQLQYLGLGVVFGALSLLVAACLAQALVYRAWAYAGYAVYATVMMLAVASYAGIAGQLLWPDSGFWADNAQGCLAMAACGASLLFVRHLCAISARYSRFDRVVFFFGVLSVLSGAAFPLVPREVAGAFLVGGVMLVTMVLGVVTSALTWWRGDRVGRWVFLAYMPMAAAAVTIPLRLFGFFVDPWLTQYAIVIAMVLKVPLLLLALSMRVRERHNAEARAQALSSQDALTGLLSEHFFRDRLRQVVSRGQRYKEPAAVVLVDLVNYASIRRMHGPAVAEQSLLRAVIKLRRVLRDVDTTSRVGEARFGLILEGVNSRSGVTARAAQLIASGLMPLKGLKPEVTLHFHVASVLLGERMGEAYDLMEHLSQLLAEMSPRTRRPIRFLEPELTRPMGLEADSVDPNPSSIFDNSRWQEY